MTCWLCGYDLRASMLGRNTKYTFTDKRNRRRTVRVHVDCLTSHLRSKMEIAERAGGR